MCVFDDIMLFSTSLLTNSLWKPGVLHALCLSYKQQSPLLSFLLKEGVRWLLQQESLGFFQIPVGLDWSHEHYAKPFLALTGEEKATAKLRSHFRSSIIFWTENPRVALCLSTVPLLQGFLQLWCKFLCLTFSHKYLNSSLSNSPLSTRNILAELKIDIYIRKIFLIISSFLLVYITHDAL